jgi:hypothetical protein
MTHPNSDREAQIIATYLKESIKDIREARRKVELRDRGAELHKHHWRAYGQPDGTVVCGNCNTGIDVNELITQENARYAIEVMEGLKDKTEECYDIDDGGEAFDALPMWVIDAAITKEGEKL